MLRMAGDPWARGLPAPEGPRQHRPNGPAPRKP